MRRLLCFASGGMMDWNEEARARLALFALTGDSRQWEGPEEDATAAHRECRADISLALSHIERVEHEREIAANLYAGSGAENDSLRAQLREAHRALAPLLAFAEKAYPHARKNLIDRGWLGVGAVLSGEPEEIIAARAALEATKGGDR